MLQNLPIARFRHDRLKMKCSGSDELSYCYRSSLTHMLQVVMLHRKYVKFRRNRSKIGFGELEYRRRDIQLDSDDMILRRESLAIQDYSTSEEFCGCNIHV